MGSNPNDKLIARNILKSNGEPKLRWLTSILKSVWQNEIVPGEWKRDIIVRILKRYNLIDCSNWKSIIMLSVPSKVMSNVLVNKIKGETQSVMLEEPAKF